jgi:hypothetical protein
MRGAETMTKKNITDIVGTVVDELTPLSSEERQRVIRATLALLGEAPQESGHGNASQRSHAGGETGELPHRARSWMQQNGLLMEELLQVFHFSGTDVEVIAAEIPGKVRGEQTRNVYLLTGVSRLLASGEPTFDDKGARALCEASGCYDSTNHTKYLKEKGNEFTGSKDAGWTLTAPGLKRAAALIRELSKHN